MFDTKIAVLLRDDLAGWQALNVTAFLVSGLPEVLRGEPYVDADDVEYLPMFGQPVVVLQGDRDLVRKAHERALNRDQVMSIFTADLFATGNDADNRAAVRKVHTQDLDLVGIAVHGRKNAVDKIFKGARMHP
ncbi:DUF2000 domain-containing protein [Lentzea sp. DG1S-22]|uniref:DUF2000 domain-containing protein n=1 Tax=Lentzea sp. DG1S-22 TaxID=3108822 RepID=UPI002E75D3C8|nr:DUF2000 domain-containing protein [Lentzea sp. DG1S-22]WVH79925.1 DUF2000 domain-containing protein [Lentzea sp. DG1S-22]